MRPEEETITHLTRGTTTVAGGSFRVRSFTDTAANACTGKIFTEEMHHKRLEKGV